MVIAPELVPALGLTLPAAPIGAAAFESVVAEATTEGEAEVLPADPCAKAADTDAVGITAAATSTRSKRLEASFPFPFSEASPVTSWRGQSTTAAMDSR